MAFTGFLASMTRRQAHQFVRDAGGEPTDSLSRRTSMLVVGMDGWPLLADGQVSRKLQRADQLNTTGAVIQTISEAVFLELLGLQAPQPAVRKTYPAADICAAIHIEPQTLRRWEQCGLVRSNAGLYDFQDLVSLRTIADLVKRGVQPATISRSLRGLSAVLPGTERPLAQLKLVLENNRSLLAELDDACVAPDGQLTLNFEGGSDRRLRAVPVPAARTPNECIEHGRACEEQERFSEAAQAYGRAIAMQPDAPEAYFNLGNVLRSTGSLEAAMEQYRMALQLDPALAEAWYNLADIQEERNEISDAITSLGAALDADSSYADAHFNLGFCYERLGRKEEASRHWNAYLALDRDSAWSDIARQHLARP